MSPDDRILWFLRTVCGAVLLLFIVNTVYVAWNATPFNGHYPVDDAFIFVRYADHILEGEGIAWNPGQGNTYGATSLSYLLLVTIARAISPLAVEPTLQILTWTCGIAFLLLMGAMCRWYSESWLMRSTCFGFLVVLLIYTPQRAYWWHFLSGLETTLAFLNGALLIISTFWMVREQSSRSIWVTALVGYWCFLTRPDAGLYALLFPSLALLCWKGWQSKRAILYFVLAFVALLCVDIVLKTVIFDSPLPLPFYAKKTTFHSGYAGYLDWNTLWQVLRGLIMASLPVTLLILGTRKRDIRFLVPFLVPYLLHWLYLLQVLQITGSYARYYMPGYPFLTMGALLIFDRRLVDFEQLNLSWVRQFAYRFSYAGLFVIAVSPLFGERLDGLYRLLVLQPVDQQNEMAYPMPPSPLPELTWHESMVAFSQLLPVLPPGSVAAMSEVGYTGYVAPGVHIIDVAGLNDPHIAKEGFSVDYVLQQEPDLIWLPHYDYADQVHAFYTSDDFIQDYMILPGAFQYGIAIRKDSPHAEKVFQRVKELWPKYYGSEPIAIFDAEASELEEKTKRIYY